MKIKFKDLNDILTFKLYEGSLNVNIKTERDIILGIEATEKDYTIPTDKVKKLYDLLGKELDNKAEEEAKLFELCAKHRFNCPYCVWEKK